MLNFVTGDIFLSDAYALVNTVNCEGYMGKGLAYQFKMRFPEMNAEYVKLCKKNELIPGKLHCYKTNDKLIINFPTKNSWREKSKMEYINSGLDELIVKIHEYGITSIAIPPLGSGNGGLNWNDVKQVIVNKLSEISKTVNIYIYEPSYNRKSIISSEPQLSLSALIIMNIKFNLNKNFFNKICLQKTAYFMNILSNTEYFHFKKAQYGPFDHSIEIISKNIREFQQYHNVQSTEKAYEILMQKLISQQVQGKIDFYLPFISEATSFTNQFNSTEEVEGAGTALFIIQENQPCNADAIINEFKAWSEDKASRFTTEKIISAINALEKFGFIENTLCGYVLKSNI